MHQDSLDGHVKRLIEIGNRTVTRINSSIREWPKSDHAASMVEMTRIEEMGLACCMNSAEIVACRIAKAATPGRCGALVRDLPMLGPEE